MPGIARLLRRIGLTALQSYEHPSLGTFERDAHRTSLFVREVDWCGGRILLILDGGEDPTREKLEQAAAHFLAMREIDDLVVDCARDTAGSDLFAKWLFDWDGDEDVSLAQWKQRCHVERLFLSPEGEVLVDFAFNETFENHRVSVTGKANIDFREAFLSV